MNVSGCHWWDIGHTAGKMKLPVIVVLVVYSQCYRKPASVSGIRNYCRHFHVRKTKRQHLLYFAEILVLKCNLASRYYFKTDE